MAAPLGTGFFISALLALRVSFGLTPEQYRAKWGLPVDYPMTAPNYTAGRSAFAKKVGFGTKKARAAARARAGKK